MFTHHYLFPMFCLISLSGRVNSFCRPSLDNLTKEWWHWNVTNREIRINILVQCYAYYFCLSGRAVEDHSCSRPSQSVNLTEEWWHSNITYGECSISVPANLNLSVLEPGDRGCIYGQNYSYDTDLSFRTEVVNFIIVLYIFCASWTKMLLCTYNSYSYFTYSNKMVNFE